MDARQAGTQSFPDPRVCIACCPSPPLPSLQVLFHDTSKYPTRVPLLTDYYGFTMASLGTHGAIYASPPDPADGVPAMIVYRAFDAWAPNSDWQAALPMAEVPLVITAGTCFAAAATSRGLLRIFTPSGIQHFVMRLDGPIVTMAAHVSGACGGTRPPVAVVHRQLWGC